MVRTRRLIASAITGVIAISGAAACSSGSTPQPAAAAPPDMGQHLSIGQDPTTTIAPIASPTSSRLSPTYSASTPAKSSRKPSPTPSTAPKLPAAPIPSAPGPTAPVLVPAGWSHTRTDIGTLAGSTALHVPPTPPSRSTSPPPALPISTQSTVKNSPNANLHGPHPHSPPSPSNSQAIR